MRNTPENRFLVIIEPYKEVIRLKREIRLAAIAGIPKPYSDSICYMAQRDIRQVWVERRDLEHIVEIYTGCSDSCNLLDAYKTESNSE